ncbi:hypothetical protein JRO89_XS01G0404100 [Xanthoceras sorbifolium]|uniref:Tobamovirus multiplication protein 2A n=1 Tax=Xanthoceras sorbifolium TaxID=99658 RepID=A0ABQ8IPV8_9ROSI|nr:hypothetical protein JRO89_XS01G0404100 [Xanthoceras sorbifolium]
MTCRGCLECLLKLLNFLLTLVGLTMVGYGIYLFVEYKRAEANNSVMVLPANSDQDLVHLGRPMLMAVSLSANIFDNLPKAWFIYLFIGVGVVLFVISCFGCVGASTRNGCCLSCYSVLVILLILVELGCAAFIFFDKTWKHEIPTDRTGYFDMIYDFLKENWNIVRWAALGVVILEVSARTCDRCNSNEASIMLCFLSSEKLRDDVGDFLFKVLLFRPKPFVLCLLVILLINIVIFGSNILSWIGQQTGQVEYDSDDEIIASRQQIRQPFLNRPPPPATGVPVAGTLDQRPTRNDAWSSRMREKYGLDTSEFTYNPSESHRFQQVPTPQTEERSRCTIM